MPPRLYARGADRAAQPDDRGVYRLRAEGRWFVEGEPGAIDAIDRALGSASTRIGRAVLELRFGNGVGWYDAGPLGHLDVRSGKWGEDDYSALLTRLTEVAAALPFSAGTAATMLYERTPAAAGGVDYQAFAHLRHLIGSPVRPNRRLVGALASVSARPHQRTARPRRVVPTALASQVDARTLVDLASGRWPLVRAVGVDVPPGLDGRLPMWVEESTLAADVDTAENRFVKHLLELCAALVSGVRDAARRTQRRLPRLHAECDHIDGVLRPLRRHRLWGDVGRMTHFPGASTVLQRRADYRTLFDIYNELRMGARPLVDSSEMLAFLEAKDIALLYEMWACVAVVGAVSAVLGPPTHMQAPRRSVFDLTMKRGLHARWADAARLDYNSGWDRRGRGGRRAYSVALRPDIVLEVGRGPDPVRHVFDAKFKVERSERRSDDGEPGGGVFAPADIHKMHTYRDALQGVCTAWVLYPGDGMRFFPVQGDAVDTPGALGRGLTGVGALPLPADGPGDALLATIARLLGHPPR